MKKLSYAEQLLHPNWQRRRLEMLNRADFQCEVCDAADKTLHVHHKHYVKGRMAWEYDETELQVLCKDCHQSEHDARAELDALLAEIPSGLLKAIVALVSGYVDEHRERTTFPAAFEDQFLIGQVAYYMQNLESPDILAVSDFTKCFSPDSFRDALRAQLHVEFADA